MIKRPQRYIYKIESDRFKKDENTGQLTLDINQEEAERNKELVSIGESQVIRMAESILGRNPVEDYFKKKKEIKDIKRQENSNENRAKIKKLNKDIKDLLFVKEYVMITFNTKRHYDIAVKRGLSICGIPYTRLYGTTVGIKKNTIVFVDSRIHSELNEKLECGRDPELKLVPAKYEAYKSLASSVSVPVNVDIKPHEILVVNDHMTNFKADVTEVEPCNGDETNIKEIKGLELQMEASDGNGIITPQLNEKFVKALKINEGLPTGYCIRSAFLKGMIYCFDFNQFVEEIVVEKHGKSHIVKDVWGNDIDTRQVKLILTTSMLKLWKAYASIDHYMDECKKNGFQLSVTKVVPLQLENERNMTYQFLQSLYLDDDDIEELIKPTVDIFKDILGGDYRKTVLYLKGKNQNERIVSMSEADYVKALMIDDRMLNDPFVKYRVHSMMKKAIDDAKYGVVKVKGNYTPIAGDMFGLSESIFDIRTDDYGNLSEDGLLGRGLLGANEFYSNYWNEQGVKEVTAFRAPMCTHANIRVLRLKNEENVNRWFKYMPNCTIFNSWDSSCESLSGCDRDGDTVITTDNKVIRKGVRELPALICSMSDVGKDIITEENLRKSNKNGFNNNVGKVTNRATSIRNKMSLFSEDSPEYQELSRREMAIQRIQQSVIDSIKTGKSEKVPKAWYSYHDNIVIDNKRLDELRARANGDKAELEKINSMQPDDEETRKRKEFNMKILANKKPYFMVYVYRIMLNDYKQYIENANVHCLRRFEMSVDELGKIENKTQGQQDFWNSFNDKIPVDMSPSVMNKLCWTIEREFDGFASTINDDSNFDPSILKTKREYDKKVFNSVKKVYREYTKEVKAFMTQAREDGINKDKEQENRFMFIERFKNKALEACSNMEELCNIVVDICYKSDSGKQFAWDVAGDQMIKNLLVKNNMKVKYFELCEDGDIEFCGDRFTLKTKTVEVDIDESDN